MASAATVRVFVALTRVAVARRLFDKPGVQIGPPCGESTENRRRTGGAAFRATGSTPPLCTSGTGITARCRDTSFPNMCRDSTWAFLLRSAVMDDRSSSTVFGKIISVRLFSVQYDKIENPEYGEKSKRILEQIEEGTVSAVASTISLTEILAKPIREGNVALEKQYKLLFTHFPNLSVISVDPAVAERAAFLRGKYGMKTPDSLVVACAIMAHADIFITNDIRLEKVEEIPCKSLAQM
jgi:predicted nucleic acid-binding protein